MLRLAPAHVLSDATCVRASSVSSVDVPFYFFFSGYKNFLFPPTGRNARRKKRGRLRKNQHTALLFVKLFHRATYIYLDLESNTRLVATVNVNAYSQVGLVGAIDGSRYRFRFLS